MVSPFTLGLFAPLPLAMMIPFMATQSLAMGEAFGKSFQFGKRKISSMSNEEFNKLTIQDIMNEQTANIKSLIPMLATQMNDSNQMQEKVFQEMTKLIPAFIKGLGAGSSDIISEVAGSANVEQALTGQGNISIAPQVGADNWQGFKEAMTELMKLAIPMMLGYKRTSDTFNDNRPSSEITTINEPPSSGILGNIEIHKDIIEKENQAEIQRKIDEQRRADQIASAKLTNQNLNQTDRELQAYTKTKFQFANAYYSELKAYTSHQATLKRMYSVAKYSTAFKAQQARNLNIQLAKVNTAKKKYISWLNLQRNQRNGKIRADITATLNSL